MAKQSTAEIGTQGDGERIASTRRALMIAALEEFAIRGIAATTVNQLTARAGARNSSAIHYHFGSKDKLVSETIDFVQDWFARERETRMADFEARAQAGERIPVMELMDMMVMPYVKLIEEEPWGFAAIRFLAALELELQQLGLMSLSERASEAASRFASLVLNASDSAGDADQHKRIVFFGYAVIHGFSAHEHMKHSFLGDTRMGSVRELADFYMDCGRRLLT